MQVNINDQHVAWVISNYYRCNKLYDTLLTFALEANIALYEESVGEEILYLQRLVLEGRWDDVQQYMRPLQMSVSSHSNQMCFLIKRQEYLEALSIIGAGGEMHITNTTLNIQRNTNLMDNLDQKDMGSVEVVTELLKQIQNVSPSVKEFNSLSLCLTLEKLTDNPQYSDWSVSKGRIEVMDEIYDSIRNLIPQSQFDNDLNESMTPSTHPNPGNRQGPLPGIYDLIAMASKYQYMEIQRNELKVKSNDSDKKKSSSMFIDVKSDTSGEKEESTGDGQQVTSAEEAEVILYPTLPSELNTMYASGGMIRAIPCLNAAHEEMEAAAGSRCHCIEKCDSSVFNPIIRVTNRISTHRADRNIIHRTDYVSNTNEDYVSGRSVNTSALPHANAEFGGTGAHMTSTNVDPNGATIRTNSHVHYDGEDSGMESRLEPETSTAATNDVMEVLSVDKRCSVLEPAMNQLKPRPSVAFEVTDNGLQTFNKVSLPKPPLARRKHAQPQPSGDSNSGDMDPASVIQVRHEHEPKQKNVSNFQKFLESKKQELAEGNINGTDVAVRIPKSPSRSTAHALSRTHALMVPAPESEGESVGMTRALSSEDSSLWLNPSGADATLLFQSPVPLRCITMLPSRHRSDAENTCVVGSNNKSLYMMQYSEGTEPTCEIVAEFKDLHRGSVYCCDAIHNPENMRPVVATGSNDKSIRLIDVEDRRVFANLKGHNGTIRSVSFNQAAHAPNLLVSGGAGDCRPRIWDISTGQCVSTLSAHEAAVHSVLWDTETMPINTNLVVSGDESGMLWIHDIRLSYNTNILNVDATPTGSFALGSNKKKSGICHMSLQRGSEGILLGAGCVGGLVSLFNMSTRQTVCTAKLHDDDCRAVCMFNQMGRRMMLTTSFDGRASVWGIDVRNPNNGGFKSICALYNAHQQPNYVSHTDKILSCCMNDLNQDLLTTGADGKVLCWKPRIE